MPDRGKITGRLLEGATGQNEIAATTHPGKRDAGECAKAMAEHGPALERAGSMSEIETRHACFPRAERGRDESRLRPDLDSCIERRIKWCRKLPPDLLQSTLPVIGLARERGTPCYCKQASVLDGRAAPPGRLAHLARHRRQPPRPRGGDGCAREPHGHRHRLAGRARSSTAHEDKGRVHGRQHPRPPRERSISIAVKAR